MDRSGSAFDAAGHYDVMAELDRDVHEDGALARSEVSLALALIGRVPEMVFLPCVGTGRHIPWLLERGVKRIVGVDLSPRCIAKAREAQYGDSRVELVRDDLAYWQTSETFDAVILLGNSFGDQTDSRALASVTRAMVRPLVQGGVLVFDYIGDAYLDRAQESQPTTWNATMRGRPVTDVRTPRFDEGTGIMTIDVVVRDGCETVWRGFYQKSVLDRHQLVRHFGDCDMLIRDHGVAADLNPDYYRSHAGELGMIARSTWWSGNRIDH